MVVPGPAGFERATRLKPMTQAVRSAMDAQDSSYFADLGRPSPAADAPPNQARAYATPTSSAQSSKLPSPYSSACSSFKKDEHGPEFEAWKRSIEAHQHDLATCLAQLESAIRAEDYERASRLKSQRDRLKARPLPPKPQISRTAAVDHALSHAPTHWNGSVQGSSCSSRQSSSDTLVHGGRTESSGLDFLFNVWQHNPQHTPTPTNVHA